MKKWMTAQKTKTFLIALAGFAALAVLLAIGSAAGGVRLLTAEVVTSPEARIDLLRRGGWEVDAASETVQQIHIPARFTDVYENYNELQKQQGYDLTPYKDRDCDMYTYTVTNYPDSSQTVLANLYVYKNRVIGGDIHSTALNGFMTGIK